MSGSVQIPSHGQYVVSSDFWGRERGLPLRERLSELNSFVNVMLLLRIHRGRMLAVC